MLETTDSTMRPDAVVAALKSEILSRGLAPGAAVTEAHVSKTYDVARPTARIAIDRLVADGLLVREPHHAAKVPRLSREDIDDLFISRAAVEAAAVELLAAASNVPKEAELANNELSRLPLDASYAARDLQFHRALVDGTGSTRLPRLHNLLLGEIELCIAQVDDQGLRSIGDVVVDHSRILEAITAGDVQAAGNLARTHVLSSRDQLVAHYDSTHDSTLRK